MVEDSGDLYAQLLLRVTQRLCGLVSHVAEAGLSAVLTAAQVPKIQQPIECSRQVTVSVVPGSTVTVFSDAPDYPQLSDPVKAYTSPITIGLYRPLRQTETIRVTASGCGGFTDAKSAVAKMPFLDQLVIRTPVRLPHGGVTLENVVPGARIHIFVNNRYRTSIDAGDTEVFVPIPGLKIDDQLTAVQALCSDLSEPSWPAAPVLRGELSVSHAPPNITTGESTSITVSATDAESGQPVQGIVRQDGVVIGQTAVPFSRTFPVGQPATPAVIQSAGYRDANLSWNLHEAQPTTATLTLALANVNKDLTVHNVAWTLYKYNGLNPAASILIPPRPAVKCKCSLSDRQA